MKVDSALKTLPSLQTTFSRMTSGRCLGLFNASCKKHNILWVGCYVMQAILWVGCYIR